VWCGKQTIMRRYLSEKRTSQGSGLSNDGTSQRSGLSCTESGQTNSGRATTADRDQEVITCCIDEDARGVRRKRHSGTKQQEVEETVGLLRRWTTSRRCRCSMTQGQITADHHPTGEGRGGRGGDQPVRSQSTSDRMRLPDGVLEVRFQGPRQVRVEGTVCTASRLATRMLYASGGYTV